MKRPPGTAVRRGEVRAAGVRQCVYTCVGKARERGAGRKADPPVPLSYAASHSAGSISAGIALSMIWVAHLRTVLATASTVSVSAAQVAT